MTLAMEKVAGLLGESPAAERIRQFAAEAASTDLPVLLLGGTGPPESSGDWPAARGSAGTLQKAESGA